MPKLYPLYKFFYPSPYTKKWHFREPPIQKMAFSRPPYTSKLLSSPPIPTFKWNSPKGQSLVITYHIQKHAAKCVVKMERQI